MARLLIASVLCACYYVSQAHSYTCLSNVCHAASRKDQALGTQLPASFHLVMQLTRLLPDTTQCCGVVDEQIKPEYQNCGGSRPTGLPFAGMSALLSHRCASEHCRIVSLAACTALRLRSTWYCCSLGRSPIFARHGMAATSQPLSTQVALDILKLGGNAIDAAIAANAMEGVRCAVPLLLALPPYTWPRWSSP